MICATPIRDVDPSYPYFMIDLGAGPLVGVVERVAPGGGYAVVTYVGAESKGKHREFVDGDGVVHEFEESGFRRAEWSAGTLVRPLMKEEDSMSDVSSPLVADSGSPASISNIKDRVAKLQGKAKANAGKASAGKGKPAPKAKKEPKGPRERNNDCLCACGGKTGGRFVPGHDARYFGWLKKVVAKEKEFSSLPASVRKALVDVKGAKAALAKH